MKRIAALILILSILTVSLSFAADFSVSVEKALEDGSVNHTVVIKGNTSDRASSYVGLVIKNSDGAVKVLEQKKANAEGSFQFDIPMNTPGEYTVTINTKSENNKTQDTFKILSSGEYNSIIALFNAEDSTLESYTSAIETNYEDLGMDMKYYSSFASDIVKILYGYKGSFTIGNFSEKFNLASLLSILKSDNVALMKEAVKYYETQLKLTSTEPSEFLYEGALALESSDSLLKTVFNKAAEDTYYNFESLRAAIEKELTKQPFSLLDMNELDLFLKNNLNVFAFNGYLNLSTAKLQYILGLMKENTALSTVSDYINYYDILYAQDINQNAPGGIIGGGGGGGGAGGGGATYTPPEKMEPELPSENKENESDMLNFSDLESVPWAKNAIDNLVSGKIVNGKSSDIFAPNDNITRAEFVKLIVCLFECHDSSKKSTFADVSENDWYNSYVASAVANSIINGRENNTFGGNENIKREDMAVILYRAIISFKAMDEVTELENNIADFDKVSDYAKNSVLMLSNMKIISGKGNGIFDPKANATRAEACVMLNNLLEGMK